MPSQGHLGARAISRLPQSFFREIQPSPPAPALIHKSPPSNLLPRSFPLLAAPIRGVQAGQQEQQPQYRSLLKSGLQLAFAVRCGAPVEAREVQDCLPGVQS
jgi:hypothetical protein